MEGRNACLNKYQHFSMHHHNLPLLTPRSVHLDEPLSRGLARRCLGLMLKICIGQNMNFCAFSGGNTKDQAVAECPEEGEEGTHGKNRAKLVMGWHDGGWMDWVWSAGRWSKPLPPRVSNPDFIAKRSRSSHSPTTSHFSAYLLLGYLIVT